jgi:hypothetical protein
MFQNVIITWNVEYERVILQLRAIFITMLRARITDVAGKTL